MSKIQVYALVCDSCGKKSMDNGKADYLTIQIKPSKADLAGEYHVCATCTPRLAKVIGRSDIAHGARTPRTKGKTPRKFTPEEDAYLLEYHPEISKNELAKKLGRSWGTIDARLKVLEGKTEQNDNAPE